MTFREFKRCSECLEVKARLADFKPRHRSRPLHHTRQPDCKACARSRRQRRTRVDAMRRLVAGAGLPAETMRARDRERRVELRGVVNLSQELLEDLKRLAGQDIALIFSFGLLAPEVQATFTWEQPGLASKPSSRQSA